MEDVLTARQRAKVTIEDTTTSSLKIISLLSRLIAKKMLHTDSTSAQLGFNSLFGSSTFQCLYLLLFQVVLKNTFRQLLLLLIPSLIFQNLILHHLGKLFVSRGFLLHLLELFELLLLL
jgi:hypothetical protein